MTRIATRVFAALLGAALMAGAAPARASTPEATVAQALADKSAVGKARLRVWGFNVYDATLYTRNGFDAGRYAEQRFALELAYLRDFEGADIAERSLKEMQDLGRFDEATGARWLAAMKGLFPDVKSGDRITGVHVPGSGARFYLNSRLLGEVTDDAFSRLFFGIWLSPRTSQPAMRDTLLQPVAGAAPRTP